MSVNVIRKWTKTLLTAFLVTEILSAPIPIMPVSAQTWNPSLGWDFECHSHTHPHLTALQESHIRWEMDHVNTAFEAHNLSIPKHHAYPYGYMDDKVKAIAAEYRKSCRCAWPVTGTLNTYPISNWYELNAVEIRASTSWNTIQEWVDNTTTNKALLCIFTHRVMDPAPQYGCTPTMLGQLLDYLLQKRDAGLLQVMTMAEAYDYWTNATEGKTTVVVSFDDGYKTDYTTVWPMFRARGLKGTSYIFTQTIGGGIDRLTWEQIEEMASEPSQSNIPSIVPYVALGAFILAIALILILHKKLLGKTRPLKETYRKN